MDFWFYPAKILLFLCNLEWNDKYCSVVKQLQGCHYFTHRWKNNLGRVILNRKTSYHESIINPSLPLLMSSSQSPVAIFHWETVTCTDHVISDFFPAITEEVLADLGPNTQLQVHSQILPYYIPRVHTKDETTGTNDHENHLRQYVRLLFKTSMLTYRVCQCSRRLI